MFALDKAAAAFGSLDKILKAGLVSIHLTNTVVFRSNIANTADVY